MSTGVDAGVLEREGIEFGYLAFGAVVVEVGARDFLRFPGLFLGSVELGLEFHNR